MYSGIEVTVATLNVCTQKCAELIKADFEAFSEEKAKLCELLTALKESIVDPRSFDFGVTQSCDSVIPGPTSGWFVADTSFVSKFNQLQKQNESCPAKAQQVFCYECFRVVKDVSTVAFCRILPKGECEARHVVSNLLTLCKECSLGRYSRAPLNFEAVKNRFEAVHLSSNTLQRQALRNRCESGLSEFNKLKHDIKSTEDMILRLKESLVPLQQEVTEAHGRQFHLLEELSALKQRNSEIQSEIRTAQQTIKDILERTIYNPMTYVPDPEPQELLLSRPEPGLDLAAHLYNMKVQLNKFNEERKRLALKYKNAKECVVVAKGELRRELQDVLSLTSGVTCTHCRRYKVTDCFTCGHALCSSCSFKAGGTCFVCNTKCQKYKIHL